MGIVHVHAAVRPLRRVQPTRANIRDALKALREKGEVEVRSRSHVRGYIYQLAPRDQRGRP